MISDGDWYDIYQDPGDATYLVSDQYAAWRVATMIPPGVTAKWFRVSRDRPTFRSCEKLAYRFY